MKFKTKSVTSLLLVMLIVGCTSISRARPDATQYPRTPSTAILQTTQTALGSHLKEAVSKNPGQSGFHIYDRGSQSLIARLALVRLAEKSVDLQYYAIAGDATSNLMMEALIRAAQRGVRVRLLVDSFTVSDMKEALLAFDGIENIQIRVFNPLMTKDQSPWAKVQTVFTDLGHANKRMHNKVLIADNQMAIMGGRNLSDEYFDADQDFEFKDIDLLTAGPITNDLSKSFDEYWNDRNSFPVSAVYETEHNEGKTSELRSKLKENWDRQAKDPKQRRQLASSLPEILSDPDLSLIWAKAELAADDPLKVVRPTSSNESEPLKEILSLLNGATKEFAIISAYFVPTEQGVEWLGGLEDRGVDVRVLTNSLASTDVVAVHSGYAPYRIDLLRRGVDLHEFIPVGQKKSRQRLLGRSQPPRAGLHSKAYIIDKEHAIIGSFNLDPRSVQLNTEMAVVIHNKEISQQLHTMFEKSIQPDVSYQLMLDKSGDELRWQGIEKGQKLRYSHEPHAGVWRNIQNFLVTLLPVEDQL
ncbi:MAG: phospholipase [Micavibrio aeruginosavorus]|uniref:Phospholipase n=1 Tax=Micavibrio aeruginosavorus TaxID=349221 RepID=A0A2W5HNR5_9BACT|nr:MAG: phospholipase [Micavibrio aeruginosavorus]